jgi:hypothetical protein
MGKEEKKAAMRTIKLQKHWRAKAIASGTPSAVLRHRTPDAFKKTAGSEFRNPRLVGSNLSRECDGGVALRRVGIEACLALPMSDPDPQFGFGPFVGIVCERGLFPASWPSGLGPKESFQSRHVRWRQGFSRAGAPAVE